MSDGRCHACDRPLATQSDDDSIPEGQGEHLCWSDWNRGVCENEPVDWRARALQAESDRNAVCTALMWAAAELRARGMEQTADRLEIKARLKV